MSNGQIFVFTSSSCVVYDSGVFLRSCRISGFSLALARVRVQNRQLVGSPILLPQYPGEEGRCRVQEDQHH